jgi:hypothetical protein
MSIQPLLSSLLAKSDFIFVSEYCLISQERLAHEPEREPLVSRL